MRIVGVLLILISFPVFLSLLRTPSGRRWLFIVLGALPILHAASNLDAALISWAGWPGHTKGLLLTLLDPLALAICVKFGPKAHRPPLWWILAIYIATLIPGLFVGTLFQPSAFYVFQAFRIALVCYAVYLVTLNGGLLRIAQGLSIALIVNAAFVVKDSMTGLSQAPGLLGHQNLTGVAVNLCVPLLVALGLRKNGSLFLFAVAAGGLSALAGGSRATIVFYTLAVVLTLVGSAVIKPTSRKLAVVSLGFVALLLASPFAIDKVTERGGLFNEDLERVAFERAAEMMIDDHPWGVGLNQYVTVANTQGYLDRAGVRWGRGARATNVHNSYLLVQVEGGMIALLGFLSLLLLPIAVALLMAFKRQVPLREASLAIAVALAVTAAHSLYEWVIVTIVPLYLIALLIGILAALSAATVTDRKFSSKKRVVVAHGRLQASPTSLR